MKRIEKIALLMKIVDGKASVETLNKLRQSKNPGAVVIIYQFEAFNPGPDEVVSFHHKGKRVTMPYKDIQAFTRYESLTICMIPDNGRRKVPESR
ncbi:hypothetical protein [Spirosoma fluviale]|uniref:Uncharacterized protein n=1 Tax=Spirosoma fluviale TaxID=1597977 RepID=A0A286GW69_9BACT|nr:hypothetical protein [Spirosoma fluviale]SOD99763.1 hypothetical protein SAMN06269250_0151 [Spirosoma fluviale]